MNKELDKISSKSKRIKNSKPFLFLVGGISIFIFYAITEAYDIANEWFGFVVILQVIAYYHEIQQKVNLELIEYIQVLEEKLLKTDKVT